MSKPASRLAEIITKVAEAAEPTALSGPVMILIDHETHASVRHEWQAANRAIEKATMRIAAMENNPELVKRRKMNDPDPKATATAELAAAEQAAQDLKAQVQDCFVAVTVRPLTGKQITALSREHADDEDARNEAHMAACIVRITDAHGQEVEGLTVAQFVRYVRDHAAFGEEQRLWDAINRAEEGVNFPT